MSFISGTVGAVSVKPQAEDQYGNTFRISLMMQDENWYSFGSSKQDNAWAKNTGSIVKGSQIEFM